MTQHFFLRIKNSNVFSAMLTVSAGTAIIRCVGILNSIMTAFFFGTGWEIDAYLLAGVWPTFIGNAIAYSVVGVTVPYYMLRKSQSGIASAQKFVCEMNSLCLILLSIAALLALLTIPRFALRVASQFTDEKILLWQNVFEICLWGMVLNGLNLFWSSILNAEGKYWLPSVAPVITPITSILALILFNDSLGVLAVAWSGIIAAGLQLFIFGISVRKLGWHLSLRWYRSKEWKQGLRRQYLDRLTAHAVQGLGTVINQTFASSLGNGNVAILDYGNRIVATLLNFFTTSLRTPLLPYFCTKISSGDRAGAVKAFGRLCWVLLALITPGIFILITFSEPIVRTLFQRGAFTQESVTIVACIQSIYALQIPFFLIGICGANLLLAELKNREMVPITIVNLGITIVGNWTFCHIMGLNGIPLTVTLGQAASCILILRVIYFRNGIFRNNRM